MKASDVSFFARHVEKIILGLGVLVLLVICVMFLIGNPYAVDLKNVPGSERLAPLDVEQYVLKKKDTLETNLNLQEQITPPTIPDYHEEYNRSYHRPVLEADARFAQVGVPPLAQDMSGPITDTTIYELAAVPMTLNVVASANHGLMDLEAFYSPDTAESYRRLIGNSTPSDFRYVSVESTFDLGEYRQGYSKIPANKRVPDYFVRSRMLITGVYLVRQTQDPISKRWGDETIVPVLPDQIAFLPDEDRKFTLASAEEAEQTLRSNIHNVIRPEFPPLVEGSRSWNPPSTKLNDLTLEQQKDLDRLNKRIKTLENQIRIAEGRPEPTARTRTPRPTQQPQFDPAMMEGGYGEPPPRATRTQRTPTTRDNSPQARLQAMRDELAKATYERDLLQAGIDPKDPEAAQKLQQANQERGVTMYGPGMGEYMPPGMEEMYEQGMLGGPGMMGIPGIPQPQQPGTEAEETLPAGQIRVWAHDLTVEPGRTYRYKVVVGVMNPLFHRKRLHPDQVEEHMHKITLVPSANDIRKAEWSEPVSVDPEFYFFVVGGSPRNQMAKVQVFRIYNGIWRQAEFDVQPGDPIGGQIEVTLPGGDLRKVNMEVGAFMVDMISVPIPGNAVGTSRLLYLDPLTNRIAERDVNEDRNANDLQRLRFEVQQGEALVQAQAQAAAAP